MLKRVITTVAYGMTLFHLYTAATHTMPGMVQRGVHLAFAFCLGFLTFDIRGKRKYKLCLVDVVWLCGSLIAMVYIIVNWEQTWLRSVSPTKVDVALGLFAIAAVMEMTRRTMGWAVPIITAAAILYAIGGDYIPGMLGHPGLPIHRLAAISYLVEEGIFGLPIGIVATDVYLFIFFGVCAEKLGAGELMTGLAQCAFGRSRGGPAKIAVVSSAAFGSISGSGVANVVVTGSLTIPLMKRMGIPSHVAGAIEAVASTGGTFLPPIMAACAFIMAANLGVSYVTVAMAAIIPGCLYYLSAFFFVDLEAGKSGLKGLEAGEVPKLRQVLNNGWYFLPSISLLLLLLVLRFNEMKVALYSSVLMVILYIVHKAFVAKERLHLLRVLGSILESCARGIIVVSAACACIGIIITMISYTGFAGKLCDVLVGVSGGRLMALLPLVMVTAIILGMGIVPTGVYILLSSLAVPTLLRAGINEVAAHFFILYFGCLAAITPPVALSCFVAAPIARADPMRIGFTAVKIAFPSFLIPFAFALDPALLGQGSVWHIITVTIFSVGAVYAICTAMQGYAMGFLSPTNRIILLVAGVCLIEPGVYTSLMGATGFLVVIGRRILDFIRARSAMDGTEK